jgi:hypothetical protein
MLRQRILTRFYRSFLLSFRPVRSPAANACSIEHLLGRVVNGTRGTFGVLGPDGLSALETEVLSPWRSNRRW